MSTHSAYAKIRLFLEDTSSGNGNCNNKVVMSGVFSGRVHTIFNVKIARFKV